MTTLRMYTDGACRGNQSDSNIGGWGTILEFGEHRKELGSFTPKFIIIGRKR